MDFPDINAPVDRSWRDKNGQPDIHPRQESYQERQANKKSGEHVQHYRDRIKKEDHDEYPGKARFWIDESRHYLHELAGEPKEDPHLEMIYRIGKTEAGEENKQRKPREI